MDRSELIRPAPRSLRPSMLGAVMEPSGHLSKILPDGLLFPHDPPLLHNRLRKIALDRS